MKGPKKVKKVNKDAELVAMLMPPETADRPICRLQPQVLSSLEAQASVIATSCSLVIKDL